MAAKIIHSLTDENADLQKQIGCMTGIFQLFDRQHMLTAGSRTAAHGHRRIPPGNSHLNGSKLERESSNALLKSASVDKYASRNLQDRQRVSTESSRASFSSASQSSSFSSPDCSGATQLEQAGAIDVRGLVKDSMYREIQSSSVKSRADEEAPVPGDLSRLQSRIIDDSRGSDVEQRPATPADLKESLRALAKLQEVSRHGNDPREFMRSSFSAPRFSYDGRDISSKTSLKLKDLPRLSLDSREGSIRSPNADLKSNVLLKNTVKDGDEVTGNQARPPSVVAKLMGLETLPDSVSSGFVNAASTSYRDTDQSKMVQPSASSKNLWKDPGSPRWRSPENVTKRISRVPIEPAPWRQIDGTKLVSTAFPSVYCEIETRLKDLEFNQSGKDLRALKRILEAMQAKGLLETPQESQDSNFTTHGGEDEEMPLGPLRFIDNRQPQSGQDLPRWKRKPASAQIRDSPIVIMKPAMLVEKSGVPATSIVSKDLIFKSGERMNGSKAMQSPTRSLQSTQEGNAGRGKNSGSVSPRIQQQKKLDLEKRSRSPASRLSNKQQTESSSPGGRRAKLHNNHQKINDISSPIHAHKNSSERSPRIHTNTEVVLPDLRSSMTLNEEESGDSGFAPAEHLSPVSVLENVVCRQDSPVKYIGKTLNVEANTNAIQQSSLDGFAPISADLSVKFEINRKKLRDIDNLVQKLRRLNSTHDEERTDYIASLCEKTDPDHRYISEILLASGLLLRDLVEFQFHPSGHPINPELFLVLEQTKSNASAGKNTCKIHRQLVFDAVNEILVGKLTLTGKRARTSTLNAQKLLRDLCSEIDGFRAKIPKDGEEKADDDWKSIVQEDVLCRSGGWMELDGDISGAVLDVERLIFKDLVNEVVMGEFAGL